MIRVPLGTLVRDADSHDLLREILHPGDQVVAARGGRGGIGNAHSREGPLEGSPGESRRLTLELKLLADVGIVGMPNAGKSTLLTQISRARPKVAAFPFTTTSPILGLVTLPDEGRLVAVDVPGLIEGAHRGRGLGLDFLRHIERTRLLVHLVDMAGVDGRDPLEDYRTLNKELAAYHPLVAAKPQILVANKMDCPGAKENLARFRKKVRREILLISAKEGKGVSELLKAMAKTLKKLKTE